MYVIILCISYQTIVDVILVTYCNYICTCIISYFMPTGTLLLQHVLAIAEQMKDVNIIYL